MSGVVEPRSRGRARGGASSAGPRLRDRAVAFLTNHFRVARQALSRLVAEPVATALTCLVIGIALSLPSLLYVAVSGVRSLSGAWSDTAQVSVFLRPAESLARGESIAAELEARAEVERVTLVPPDEALAELVEAIGLPPEAGRIEPNPLPVVLLLSVARDGELQQRIAALREYMQGLDGVDQVVFDFEWLARLEQVIDLGERLSWMLGLLLALGVVLVLGNTIRLAIENRRQEILVLKLVGATDAFVRRPFLHTGFCYGLGGGVCALLLLWVSLRWLSPPITRLLALYGSDAHLQGIEPLGALAMLIFSGLLGVSGAWLAVSRHLRAIEPQ